jgi:hypothetical protein
MKSKPALSIFSILVLTSGFQARAHAARQEKALAEIQQFEQRFTSALARNDVGELQNYLSSDWKIVSGDGGVIDRARFFKVIAGGDLKHGQMSFTDPSIRVYGDMALVTSHAQSAGSYKGVDFKTDEIGTDVIVKKGGKWLCVFTQLTTIAGK